MDRRLPDPDPPEGSPSQPPVALRTDACGLKAGGSVSMAVAGPPFQAAPGGRDGTTAAFPVIPVPASRTQGSSRPPGVLGPAPTPFLPGGPPGSTARPPLCTLPLTHVGPRSGERRPPGSWAGRPPGPGGLDLAPALSQDSQSPRQKALVIAPLGPGCVGSHTPKAVALPGAAAARGGGVIMAEGFQTPRPSDRPLAPGRLYLSGPASRARGDGRRFPTGGPSPRGSGS